MKEFLLIAVLFFQQPTPAPGIVTGSLLFSDGTCAANIQLRLTPASDGQQQPPAGRGFFTDGTGTFTQRVPPGRYFLQTTTAPPMFYPGVSSQANATPIVVAAGSTISGLNFSLPLAASGVRIQGRVIIPPGYLSPSLLRVALAGNSFKTIAPDGSFEFTHVMRGSYSILMEAPGVQPVLVTVADGDVSGVELKVPPLTPVQGTVSVEGPGARPRFSLIIEGFLAAGATPATSPNLPYRNTVSPAADGSFSTPLPPGEYHVAIANLPDGYYVKAVTADTRDILSTPLTVISADSPMRMAVALGMSAGVRVTGRVVRAESDAASPLPQKIFLTGVAAGDVSETAVQNNGTFEIPKLSPGIYSVRTMLTPGVSSPPVAVIIPNRNVADLEIPIPATREIVGKVAVDGNGPAPKFSLLLVRGVRSGNSTITTEPGSTLPSISSSAVINALTGGGSGVALLQLDVNATPEGTFTIRVPDGVYRVVAMPPGMNRTSSGIPPSYFIRSITSNGANLLTEPFLVSEKEIPEIHIGFGTAAANPWIRVSGRVKGMDSSRGAVKVALESNVTSTIETFVDGEGKFEFPAVLQRTRYTARVVPSNDAASAPRVNVDDKDVTGVEIVVPAMREIAARIIVEGNAPIPSVGLGLDAKDSSVVVVIRPDSDGTARIKVPDDERSVRLTGLPFGYDWKSVTFGSANVLREPLKVAEGSSSELKITLAMDPATPLGSLRGRITGIEAEKESVRLVLNGVTAFTRFEVPVNADGTFNLAKLPQGTYLTSLEGGGVGMNLTPNAITVTGTELAGIQIAAGAPGTGSARPDTQTRGATLADFGSSARTSANESAAVANLRTINTAQVVFLSVNGGRYGTLEDLINAGFLDGSFRNTKAGFNFSLIAIGSNYAAASVPANSATGRFGFYSTPDAVIRYSTFEPLAPTQQSGRPVQ